MPNGSQHFLLALIALQLDLIDLVTLQGAVAQWSNDRSQSLADLLTERGGLSPDERKMLDEVVWQHLARHGNDPAQSAGAIHLPDTLLDGLRQITDSELQEVLARLQPTVGPSDKGDTKPNSLPDSQSGPPPAPDAATVISDGPTTAERYRILRPHARGALGKVSVAMDVELNREVALKEMQSRFAQDESCRGRFIQEAEITGGLEHPNIVPIYGLGTYSDGRPFYAMRFIRGTSLQEAIDGLHGSDNQAQRARDFSGRNLEFRKLLMRFIDVCEAIQYAHDRGILHRDLKPGNIMLGKYGETLVVDWGIAKRLSEPEKPEKFGGTLQIPRDLQSHETIPGTLIGTPQYMSPEQAAGDIRGLGPRSDVYSLGATLFHLVAGVVPVEAQTLPEILERVRTGKFPGARDRNPHVPRALDAICRKAMAVAPDNRYASATALAKDVEGWLADEPVSADPDSLFEKVARVARRNRGAVRAAMGGALLVALVSLAAVILINEQRRKNAFLAQEKGALAEKNAALFESEREAKNRAEQLAQEMSNLVTSTTSLAEEKGTLAAEKSQLAEDNGRLAEKMRSLAAEKSDLADEQGKLAEKMRRLAEENAKLARDANQQLLIATAERLAAQSRLARRDFPQRSALLAIAAAETTRDAHEPVLPLAQEELYESLQALGGRPVVSPGVNPGVTRGGANTIVAGMRTEFTYDFRRLASATPAGDIHVWDLQAVDPAKAEVVLSAHRTEISELAFAHDGKRLASGDVTGAVRLWDLSRSDAGQSAVLLAQHHARIDRIAFAADGGRLVTADSGGEIRVWTMTTPNFAKSSVLLRHPVAKIDQLALSADSHRLATGDAAGEVRLWDLAAANPTTGAVVLAGHQKPILRLAFSNDSRRLATGDEKGEVRLWDLSAADVPKSAAVLPVHEGRIQQFVFSSDGRHLAVLAGGQVRVADLTASDLGGSSVVLRGQKGPIRECRFTPDNRWLATGGTRPGEVRLWELSATGLTANTLLTSRTSAGIMQLAASPDGKRLASLDDKGQADVWDLTAADVAASLVVLRGHDAPIQQLAFVPDNRRILTRSVDGQVRQWDLTAPDLIDAAVLAHQKPAPGIGLVFTRDSRKLATGDADGQVRIWDMTAADVPRSMIVLAGHKGRLQHLAFSHEGQRLATADARGEIRLWDLSRGGSAEDNSSVLLTANRTPIRALVFARNDKWLAARDGTGDLRIWDLAADVRSASPLQGHKAIIQQIAFSPDGRDLITADEQAEVRIWRLGAGSPPQGDILLPGSREKTHHMAFGPNARHFLLAAANGETRIWDVRAPNAAKTATLLTGHRGNVVHARFTPDGKKVVSADENGGILLWDLSAPQIARSSVPLGGHQVKIDQLVINANGRRLLTGDANGEVRLWKMTEDKVDSSAVQLHGYDSWIANIAFSDDGDWLAAKDSRGELRLWNISTSDAIHNPVVLHGNEGELLQVSFSHDGHWLATTDDRGTVRLWDLNVSHLLDRLRRAAGRDLTDAERLTYELPRGGEVGPVEDVALSLRAGTRIGRDAPWLVPTPARRVCWIHCFANHSTVCRSPSRTATVGCQPRSSPALALATRFDRKSPARSGPWAAAGTSSFRPARLADSMHSVRI